MTAHKHAALMLQYAQDAAETDKPWERWEWTRCYTTLWCQMTMHPAWADEYDYRRKEAAYEAGKASAQQERKPSDVALLKAIRESLACAKPNTDWTFLVAAIDAAIKETP